MNSLCSIFVTLSPLICSLQQKKKKIQPQIFTKFSRQLQTKIQIFSSYDM